MHQQVKELSSPGQERLLNGALSIPPLARRVMEVASEEARMLGASITSTPHILLGILNVGQPVTQLVLADPQVIMDHARAGAASSSEVQFQDRERAAEDEPVALIVEGGDSSLISLFEDVVYRWLTKDRLSENRKHTVLLHLINRAMQNRG